MIDAKSFAEFAERELRVRLVDVNTGKPLLEVLAEQELKKRLPYSDPNYKSDYDRFLEKEGGLL